MPPLSKEATAEMVGLYQTDEGATLASVGEAYGLAAQTVRKHIEAAGLPVRPEGPDVADITSSVSFKAAVAEAVAAALADAMKVSGAIMPTAAAPADWADFMASMKQLAGSLEEQKAGYQKPLSPEELASRKAGEAEFFRLLHEAANAAEQFGKRGAQQRDLLPYYAVGPNGIYAPTENGEMLFSPGQPIYLTLPPPADFIPLNEVADAIMRAQLQWHGEEVPDVGEMVANAQMRAMGRDPKEQDGARKRDRVVAEAGDGEILKVGPTRMTGVIVSNEADGGRGQFHITQGLPARPVSGPVFA